MTICNGYTPKPKALIQFTLKVLNSPISSITKMIHSEVARSQALSTVLWSLARVDYSPGDEFLTSAAWRRAVSSWEVELYNSCEVLGRFVLFVSSSFLPLPVPLLLLPLLLLLLRRRRLPPLALPPPQDHLEFDKTAA